LTLGAASTATAQGKPAPVARVRHTPVAHSSNPSSKPKNPSDTVYKNIRRGFLTESPQKKGGSKAWIVTNSGERFVENDLKEP